MSTLNTTNIKHPSSASNNIVLDSAGGVDLDALTVSGSAPADSVNIDASGRLLVGTSSARSNFYNTSFAAGLQVESITSTNRGLALINNSSADNPSSLILARSNADSIGSNAVVASGTWLGNITFQGADGSEFVEAARVDAYVDGTPGANDMPGRLVFSTTADGGSSPGERMRLTSTGLVAIGTTFALDANNATLAVGAGFPRTNIEVQQNTTSAHYAVTFRNANGLVGNITTTGSSTAFNTSSDYRLKENVTPVPDGITRLLQLRPSRFNFIADPDAVVDGFLAHEVQAVVPEAIHGIKDEMDDEGNPVYQGIDQSKLVPLLTAALQEAIGRIEALEAEVSALKGA